MLLLLQEQQLQLPVLDYIYGTQEQIQCFKKNNHKTTIVEVHMTFMEMMEVGLQVVDVVQKKIKEKV